MQQTLKKALLGILFLAICWTANAQKYKKGFTYLDKGDLEAALTAFQAVIGNDNDRPAALMGMAKIFSNKKYPEYNLETAYKHICDAIADFKKLDIAIRNKLQDDDKGAMDLAKVQRDIITAAYEVAKKENTASAYGAFLNTYTAVAKPQMEIAIKMRDLRAVEEAEKADKFNVFEDWYRQCHPTALKYAPEVAIRGQKGLFETYIKEKSWNSYGEFAVRYKDNVYVRDSVAAKSFVPIALANTVSGYRDFLKNYATSPFAKLAKDYLYTAIMQNQKIDDYDFFVRSFPDYPKVNDIWKLFYNAYLQSNGLNSVFEFEQKYPGFPLKEQLEKDKADARKKSEAPIYEKTRVSRDPRDFMRFVKDFPNSPYFASLEGPMLEALRANKDWAACELFAKMYPKSDSIQTVYNWIFRHYAKDGEWSSLDLFEQRYPRFARKDLIIAERTTARLGVEIKPELPWDSNRRQMYEDYIQRAAPRSLAIVALHRYIEKDILAKNWEAALAKVERFKPFFGENNYEIGQMLEVLKTPRLAQVATPIAFPSAVNTQTSEYVPLMSADEHTLYFCRWDMMDRNEEIFMSEKKDGQWQKAVPVEDLNDKRSNEGPMTLSADGNQMIIFVEGNLYTAERTETGWSAPTPLPDAINSDDYWDADASFTADGNALFFISRRPGITGLYKDNWGLYHGDAQGNSDIFVCTRKENGGWNDPINVGTVINTPFAERTPFLHYDMKTLYFSSDGHGGLGRMDVYKSERLDDSWTNWSRPVNLGKEINTVSNDWGYKISTDGTKVYFAAAKNNSADQDQDLDIFELTLPESARPDKVCTVSGKITDIDNKPVAAHVVWEDLGTGKKMGELKTNPQTGDFFIVIPEGKQYSYYISKEGYFPQADNIDLREKHCPVDIQKDIQLIQVKEMAEREIALPLKNLFFDFNKYVIKEESYPELDRLMEMVKLALQFNYNIEINGHTDNVGSDKDNLLLSQNRAKAVRDYLIQKGCPTDKIISQGFGEGKPIATNDTDEGRASNRRVEVRFHKD